MYFCGIWFKKKKNHLTMHFPQKVEINIEFMMIILLVNG